MYSTHKVRKYPFNIKKKFITGIVVSGYYVL